MFQCSLLSEERERERERERGQCERGFVSSGTVFMLFRPVKLNLVKWKTDMLLDGRPIA